MTKIELVTSIKASAQTVFDFSRNIDIHQKAAGNSNESAIAGRTSGLITLHETVTWRGKHFGIYFTHKSIITAMDLYDYFVDEMLEGKFKSFRHQHFFKEENGVTTMTDIVSYETPYGILGKLFDRLLLKKHLREFILKRNQVLTSLSEKTL